MSTRRFKTVGAFTLIELLVVVAIIALLISILLPSLNGARKAAKQTVCTTHIRNQYNAANFYKEDNSGYLLGGILSNDVPQPGHPWPPPGPLGYEEFGLPHQFWLKYLNYTSFGDATEAVNHRIENLYPPHHDGGPLPVKYGRRMARAYASIEAYQCPDFPLIEEAATGDITTSVLDYSVNAMPIPFTEINALVSNRANGMRPLDEAPGGVSINTVWYMSKRKESSVRRTAEFIYIAEWPTPAAGSVNLPSKHPYRFQHFFLASHLPFANDPRISFDKRHPGGINGGFFDGHVETLSPNTIDPGWPNSMAIRLQKFTDISELSDRWQRPYGGGGGGGG